MTKREMKMFKIAKEIGEFSTYPKQRVGAVVCESKRIISTGFNSNKTNPLQHRYNIHRDFDDYDSSTAKCHAEVSALAPLIGKDVDWNRTSIFIYREHKDGHPACSRPCAACHALIHDLGVKEIYFIDEESNYIKERIL